MPGRESTWEILPGLPVYGAAAEPFSATGLGMHREGLVVRFEATGGSWVGNFQRGMSSCDRVLTHPDRVHVLVIAGGAAYVVDPSKHRLEGHFGADIQEVIEVPEIRGLIFGNGLWFEAVADSGPLWRSRRISWDGLRKVTVDGTVLRGEAYAPEGADGAWHGFEVNVLTGEAKGGSYGGPPM